MTDEQESNSKEIVLVLATEVGSLAALLLTKKVSPEYATLEDDMQDRLKSIATFCYLLANMHSISFSKILKEAHQELSKKADIDDSR